ncbi:MAG: CotH kinase family protein [Ignavibacteriales bacterium]|nr:CotH kinase family protein [Ignavibacteriales bacterium]MCF8317077.1 CotH kinase family protein [Ignavibacteriales bacterium]MCF8438654.1 CotH kinase family protein [Ignavibacteriales bacterium]
MKKNIFNPAIIFAFLLTSSVYSQTFTSSNLPIFIIDTYGQPIPDEPKIPGWLGIIFNGEGNINNITDPWNHYNGHIAIEIRGSSSQMFPKKQYGMDTRDASGEDLNVSLLGFPEESDWVLYAPYSDKSLMRNILAYKIGRDLGHYATRTHLCEVVLNGDYAGVYVFEEKIKRDKNRVDIKKMGTGDIAGDAVTGGYIFAVDKIAGSSTEGWYSNVATYPESNYSVYYQYNYPKAEDLVPEQISYLQSYVLVLETLLMGESFDHPFYGFMEKIDIDGFVDYYIANEITKNVDSYRLSTFLVKDRSSINPKLQPGPIWDFNLGFGNADYYEGGSVQDWRVDFTGFPEWEGFLPPAWWHRIFHHPLIQNRFAIRWKALRQGKFSTINLMNYIDSVYTVVKPASIRNFQRWPVLGIYVWPNNYIGATYEDEMDYFRNYVNGRLQWIDAQMPLETTNISFTAPLPSGIIAEEGKYLSVPLSYFFSSASGYDSIRAVSEFATLETFCLGDSLYLHPYNTGENRIKLRFYEGGSIVEISPSHIVHQVPISGLNDHLKLPETYELGVFPNPFNASTNVSIKTNYPASVLLEIFTVTGEKILGLEKENSAAGELSIPLDLINVSSGIYLLRGTISSKVSEGSVMISRKLMLMK